MGRVQIMIIEIAGLLIVSILIRFVLGMYGIEEGMFLRWFPILAALLIVYTVRFRIRKKLIRSKTENNDDTKQD
ncbi:MAG: hypothetical protein VX523_00095 [Chloroflexota bacterium]|nr:hypothetical protein [Chloroflexota bacterium]